MITNKNCRCSKEGIFLRLLIAALISFGAVVARAQEPVPVEDHSTITTYEDENILSSDLSLRRLNVNGNSVYIFTNAASAQVVKAKRGIVLVDCLLVGGGGGGGCGRAGGGGGGGVTNVTDIVGAYIDMDDTFTLAVGAGGAGGSSNSVKGGNGGETSLEFGMFDATVAGGGGGGSWNSRPGANGASGGGGAQDGAGGAGIDGMGFAGANGGGGNSAASGGGGGAGHVGYAADITSKIAGNGGEGIASSITGTEVYYGGGGGGGGGAKGLWHGYVYDSGSGGLGGGGDGGYDSQGVNGIDGLGGGGGGGGASGSGVSVTDKAGGNGGSGIAVLVLRPLAYEIAPIPDQVHESFEPCRPEFVVSNRLTGATWRVGGDIVSEYFVVEYENNIGVGTAKVIITGKGACAEANYVRYFNITATKYEDANISTTDLSSRRVIVDGKSVYVFTNAAAAQVVTAKRGINLTDFLVVGGGGGGGCTMAGGGGGGGGANATGLVGMYVNKGDTFTLAVGAGGAGSVSTSSRGGNGGDTSLNFGLLGVTVSGGGGGGCRSGATGTAGLSGGSGGGGAPNAAGGAGIDGQGFAGAAGGGSNSGKSGGGGGAGHAGYANVDGHSGYGGEGVSNNITGAWVVYGGGGGGGGAAKALFWNTDAGLGGIGGGGNGGKDTEGANGVDGLGGGGGGGGAGGASTSIVNKRGGDGGVGTVILAVAGADFNIEPIPDQILMAGGSKPVPVVSCEDTLLVEGVDYTVSYTDNDKPGVATITITGINDYAGKSAVIAFKTYLCYFVDDDAAPGGDGSEASPFATISNAIEKADAGIAGGAQSVTIQVADGTYPENGLVVTNVIFIAGNASDRTAVKIGKTGARVFRIANAGAVLKNLTVQNGTVPTKAEADAGGNVRLEAGTVTNCVLTGGGTTSVTDNKGGNLYISGGSVVDCLMTSPLLGPGAYGGSAYIVGGVVSRCIIEKSPKPNTYTALGAGAYLTGGVIENCLIRENHGGRGALYLNSSAAKAVNCTIVGNTPEGSYGGVYVNNASASVINCVIYGNGGTAAAEWGNKNGERFFNCVSTVENANGVNWTKLPFATRSAYFKDDEFWTPLLGSPMVDGGNDSLYPLDYSQTDLAGKARISGSHIDIGCSEFDQSSFSFSATLASHPSISKGNMVDFVCTAAGTVGTVTFELDFGDGSSHLVTTDTQISHRFDVVGLFPTRIRAKDETGEYSDWQTLSIPIRVAEADIYVSTEGSDANAGTAAAPFRTITHALATLTNVISSCATDVDGVTVHIAAGTYEENGLPTIGSRVTVEGIASDRNAVKVGKSGARIFCLTDEDAVLRNLTVTNGTVTAADISYAGGNVRLEAGTVTNCVLTGGSDTVQDGKGLNLYISGGIAVDSLLTSPLVKSGTLGPGAYIAGGVVSRCIIEKASKKASTWLAIGAGAYMKGGVIENCLLRDNFAGRGTIYLDDASAKAVNCTIVNNIEESGVGGGFVGVYMNSSSASVVNCVVYGNGGTASKEWGNKNAPRFFNCAFAENAAFTGANSTVINLTDAAFKNYAKGDYRPKREGALVNSGSNDLYLSYATSATDINGAPRIQGKIIDIGCWEVLSSVGSLIIVR